MYLVKLLKKNYRALAISHGKLRIGTINYYRKIEDNTRKDSEEGLGNIIWAGNKLPADQFNKIFTPFDNVSLKEGWAIENNGAKIIGASPNFNLFIFCYSWIDDISEISKISESKATDYFFITDLHQFVIKLTNEVKRIGFEMVHQYEPERAEEIIKRTTVVDTTYKVFYSNESKSRVVTEENVENFEVKKFLSFDLFQKNKSYEFEQEVRTAWTFVYQDEKGRKQALQLPHPDLDYIDVEIGELPISLEPSINKYPIKTSCPKPKNV